MINIRINNANEKQLQKCIRLPYSFLAFFQEKKVCASEKNILLNILTKKNKLKISKKTNITRLRESIENLKARRVFDSKTPLFEKIFYEKRIIHFVLNPTVKVVQI